jgi:WhiB family redox-sensing transcriptional regulator
MDAPQNHPHLNLSDNDWMEQAGCKGEDREVFFDQSYESKLLHDARVAYAKSICNVCLVKEVCLQFALDTNQQHHIWGGKTAEERRSKQF